MAKALRVAAWAVKVSLAVIFTVFVLPAAFNVEV